MRSRYSALTAICPPCCPGFSACITAFGPASIRLVLARVVSAEFFMPSSWPSPPRVWAGNRDDNPLKLSLQQGARLDRLPVRDEVLVLPCGPTPENTLIGHQVPGA